MIFCRKPVERKQLRCPHKRWHLLDEGQGDQVPGHDAVIHQLQEGGEGEGQHLPKTAGETRQPLSPQQTESQDETPAEELGRRQRRAVCPTHWVPLSTKRASVPMPSMLMNSAAKVASADSLASSFRASSRASMPWDWIRSRS